MLKELLSIDTSNHINASSQSMENALFLIYFLLEVYNTLYWLANWVPFKFLWNWTIIQIFRQLFVILLENLNYLWSKTPWTHFSPKFTHILLKTLKFQLEVSKVIVWDGWSITNSRSWEILMADLKK